MVAVRVLDCQVLPSIQSAKSCSFPKIVNATCQITTDLPMVPPICLVSHLAPGHLPSCCSCLPRACLPQHMACTGPDALWCASRSVEAHKPL